MDSASWEFFLSEEKGKEFQDQGENKFGPVVFPFWNAWDQFRLDLVADGAREPSQEEFLKVLQGQKIDFYEENDKDLEFEQENRLEPDPALFEDIDEALSSFRESALYIWNHMDRHAIEVGFDIVDYNYYDGFLSVIGRILDEYFEDIENYERMLEHLYDGVDDMVNDDE
jgi:hypothetical protein